MLEDGHVPNTVERSWEDISERASTVCTVPETGNSRTHTETSRNVAWRAGVGGGRDQTGACTGTCTEAASFWPGLCIRSPERLQVQGKLLVFNANSSLGGLESLQEAWGS